jgi:ubiquinone/menaquinone biosynthesis C-methylase UbiE
MAYRTHAQSQRQPSNPDRELQEDTARWLEPRPGERWLDLGCGNGDWTALLWRQSHGQLKEIVAVDRVEAHEATFAKMIEQLRPSPRPGQIHFMASNFHDGLPQFADTEFDGIIAGLFLPYVESRDPDTGCYTDDAYNRLLSECRRVLKPDGRFIFSAHVPELRLWPLFRQTLETASPGKALLDALHLQRYARWLRRESQRGRFHFFALPDIIGRLSAAGFLDWKSRLSYAGQAYVICARKEAAEKRMAA